MRTAELAGLTAVKPDPDLLEWDYGGYEGMTETQIRETRPGWYLWQDGVIPGGAAHPGETLQQVAARTDAVLNRIRPLLNDGDVALVAHGHLQRVLTARWLGLDPSAGRLLRHPHPGTLSALDRARGAGHLRLEPPMAAAPARARIALPLTGTDRPCPVFCGEDGRLDPFNHEEFVGM